jgi:hypothetical protein
MYTVDENGLFSRPEGFEDSVDGVSFNFWWGRNDNLEYRNAQLDWDAIGAMYDAYDQVKIDYPYGQYIYDNSIDDTDARILFRLIDDNSSSNIPTTFLNGQRR